jgi:hypothetical protein
MPPTSAVSLHEILVSHGYKLIDDAWSSQGRRTYIHDDDATRVFILGFAKALRSAGWETHPIMLRAFRHPISGELIELEPGGADTRGHFLHRVKTFD